MTQGGLREVVADMWGPIPLGVVAVAALVGVFWPSRGDWSGARS